MSSMDHCPIYAYNKTLQNNENKMISDPSANITSKMSPTLSPHRHTTSSRQTRNSMGSPITAKFEKEASSTFGKQKSPTKTESIIDEHQSRDSDELFPASSLSTIRSQVCFFIGLSFFVL